MHALAAMASAAGAVDLDTFPAWLRITHFINFIMMGFLIRSGWEVLASHPRLYWNNHCTPGSEWLKFTKDKVSTVPGEFTARDDQRNLHPLISLPGRGQIGLGHGHLAPQRLRVRRPPLRDGPVAAHRTHLMVHHPRGLGECKNLHGPADSLHRALPAL